MIIRGRWAIATLIVLFVSLGGNFFVAGWWLAKQGLFRSAPEAGMARLTRGVPPAGRELIKKELTDNRAEIARELQAVRQARRAVAQELRSPEIDERRLDAALADLRARSTASQEIIQGAVVRAARQLPPEVRAQWQPRLGGTAEP